MYTLILNKVFKYKLMVSGFTKTDTLSFRTTDFFTIIAQWQSLLYTSAIVKINTTMEVLSVKNIEKPTPIINIYQVSISALSKVRQKIQSVIVLPLIVEALATVRARLSSIISIPLIVIATAIVGRFYKLVEHDPKTLGEMDIQTLGDLDYIET